MLALLPVFAGMAVRAKLPAAASRIHVVLRRMARNFRRHSCLPPCFCGASSDHIGQFPTLGPGGVASAVSEHVRRRSLSGDLRSRICAAADAGYRSRHAELAQAIALASSPLVFADDSLAVPAIVYALLMNGPAGLCGFVPVPSAYGCGHRPVTKKTVSRVYIS